MIGNRVTHRTVDGIRIPGTWRPAFIRNGHHHLIDLFIYADGLIDCWGLCTVEEFEEKLRIGWVATTVPEGAAAAAPGMGEWLSVADPEVSEAVTVTETYREARKLALMAPRRKGWEQARAAFMTSLLRAKYDQHPELADILLATDDATLVYDDFDSAFWGHNAGQGRNWTGRLLKLVRSELHMRRSGIPCP
ncbi:NADAR family protein [Streptomyces sp. NBC_01298]|uniref:NADAR family protein n=1 Tax=Streptomyces sp. NBC_01298 TaxID=2903817 RepID=UPI002E0F3706|nr:NADAR family protein [Streptomyces sp. NBC_01298]